MSKQPFYHCGEGLVGDRDEIIKAIKSIKTVLKDSIELFNGELLFTATSDVSNIANIKIKEIATIEQDIFADPGDPADLLDSLE